MWGRQQPPPATPRPGAAGASPVVPLPLDDRAVLQVEAAIKAWFVRKPTAPSVRDLAAAARLDGEVVRRALLALHAARRLVVQPSVLAEWGRARAGERNDGASYAVEALPPFSGLAFGMSVVGGDVTASAGGALHAFALPHVAPLAAGRCVVEAVCAACGRDIAAAVERGHLPFPDSRDMPMGHFPALAPGTGYAQATSGQRLLCGARCLASWRRRASRGVALDANDLWRLGKLLELCRSRAERTAALAAFGLTGPFWEDMAWYKPPKAWGGEPDPRAAREAVRKNLDWIRKYERGGGDVRYVRPGAAAGEDRSRLDERIRRHKEQTRYRV